MRTISDQKGDGPKEPPSARAMRAALQLLQEAVSLRPNERSLQPARVKEWQESWARVIDEAMAEPAAPPAVLQLVERWRPKARSSAEDMAAFVREDRKALMKVREAATYGICLAELETALGLEDAAPPQGERPAIRPDYWKLPMGEWTQAENDSYLREHGVLPLAPAKETR